MHADSGCVQPPEQRSQPPLPDHAGEDQQATLQRKLKQGRGLWGVDLRIVGEDGEVLPRDGKSSGALQVRGPWVSSAYFKNEGADVFTDDGWFDTGDIATLDAEGYLRLTDRAKDVIKSGGEWISSCDVENAALLHPTVAAAAAIGVAHPHWGERPILYVQPKPGTTVDADAIRAFLANHLAKWCIPDEVYEIAALPLGATGKVDKKRLRAIHNGN